MRKFVILMLLVQFSLALGSNTKAEKNDKATVTKISDKERILAWKHFMEKTKWATTSFMDIFKPKIKHALKTADISKPCASHLRLYFIGIRKRDPWALKMIDATGKIPSGVLAGKRVDLGSFDSCLKVRSKGNDTLSPFKGRFCLVRFKEHSDNSTNGGTPNGTSNSEAYGKPPARILKTINELKDFLNNFGFCFGTCLPSTCSSQDVQNFFEKVTESWTEVLVPECQDDDSMIWTSTAIFGVCILLTILGVCVFGTWIDIKSNEQKDTEERSARTIKENFSKSLLKTFSLNTTTEKLFSDEKENHFLDCLHGIRFFLSIWVQLSHTVLYPEVIDRSYTFGHTTRLLPEFLITPLANFPLSIETFIVISGFLMAFSAKKIIEKNNGNINFLGFIIKKIFRLLPVSLLYVVLVFAAPVTWSGPLGTLIWNNDINNCKVSWWRNMLFIQNFSNIEDMCVPHTWYIAVLLQLHVTGLFLLIFTYRFPKAGSIIGSIMVIACISRDYNASLSNKVLLQSVRDIDAVNNFKSNILFLPFNHLSSYLLGMVLGWNFLSFKDKKLSKLLRFIYWITSITVCLVVLYGISYPTTNLKLIASYIALRNICWGLSTSWILFNLFISEGGIFHSMLSMGALVPLGRLSYSFYLLHFYVLLFRTVTKKQKVFMNIIDLVFEALSTCIMSVFVACLGYLTVESPFNSIYKLFIKKYFSKCKKEKTSSKVVKKEE